jgi:hypothetical protein
MFVGFMPFYLSGRGQHDRVIAPAIFTLVAVHGLAITGWYVLALAQSLLIANRNHRVHMKLGWSAVGLGLVIAYTGVMVAIRSVQGAPEFVFFGMAYPDFLLVMFAEIAVFTALLVAGLGRRKRPAIHRSMMLLASLSLLLGATARMPWLNALFGGDNRMGFFGPVFALGVVLLLVRYAITRTFDRWFAAGHAFMIIVYLAAEQLSRTDTWRHLASLVLKA